MTGATISRPLLIIIWMVALVPVGLLCAVALVMAIGIGSGVQHRSNWPQYVLMLCLPVVAVALSISLARLSLRLWEVPRWRWASFPMAASYYAAVAFISWGIIVKHWIQ
jgi:hypothetical protein